MMYLSSPGARCSVLLAIVLAVMSIFPAISAAPRRDAEPVTADIALSDEDTGLSSRDDTADFGPGHLCPVDWSGDMCCGNDQAVSLPTNLCDLTHAPMQPKLIIGTD